MKKRSMQHIDATTITINSSNKPIQLLLHAPDGIVPYLTPTLLLKYVGGRDDDDDDEYSFRRHLLLGICVHETYLVPLYPTPECTKPRGYQFQYKSSPKYIVEKDLAFQTVMVPSFDLLKDAQKRRQTSVQATDKGISTWSLQGRQLLSNQDYIRLAKEATTGSSSTTTNATKEVAAASTTTATTLVNDESKHTSVAAVVSLYDQVMTCNEKQQRVDQATTRNETWLKEMLQSSNKNDAESCQSIWAPIMLSKSKQQVPDKDHGGFHRSVMSPENMRDTLITGYAVVGFEHEEPSCRREQISKLRQQDHYNDDNDSPNLQSSKTIAVLRVDSIESILECVKLGVDVIGTCLPTSWSLAHQAICFPVDIVVETDVDADPIHKKCKNEDNVNNSTESGSSSSTTTTTLDHSSLLLLDLKDTVYAKDGAPLLEKCTCFTCQHHTRAYIHHLYQAKELLAQILLMGHNLHNMIQFCIQATKARNRGQIETFLEQVTA